MGITRTQLVFLQGHSIAQALQRPYLGHKLKGIDHITLIHKVHISFLGNMNINPPQKPETMNIPDSQKHSAIHVLIDVKVQ